MTFEHLNKKTKKRTKNPLIPKHCNIFVKMIEFKCEVCIYYPMRYYTIYTVVYTKSIHTYILFVWLYSAILYYEGQRVSVKVKVGSGETQSQRKLSPYSL